jgi:hypothetical protein
MDPAEMLWQCSIGITSAGEDVVVAVTRIPAQLPALTSPAAQVASVPGAAYSTGHRPALRWRHPHR